MRIAVLATCILALIGGAAGRAAAQSRPASSPAPAHRLGNGSPDWRRTLSPDGPLPGHERLVVVAADGRVLGRADGTDRDVDLPADVYHALAAGTAQATIVHNHVANRGLSCADLRQLGNPGVTRVVAVTNGGTVFEAAAGPRYDARWFAEDACLPLLREVATNAAVEIGVGFSARSDVADQVPHLLAAAFARAGVLAYAQVPAVDVRITLARHDLAFTRVIARTAAGLAGRTTVAAPAIGSPGASGPTLSQPRR